jgi:catechol 2,3-dioxygenase-like lactoylglutathione lyase family enzyme
VVDWKIEVVPVPVSDIDRAKSFYTEKLGFSADLDTKIGDDIRFVQLTPPGSACSITLGVGTEEMEPGSLKGLQMVVSDIHAAHTELVERGVDVGEIQEFDTEQGGFRPLAHEPDWNAFIFFNDPDGNSWVVQHYGGNQTSTGSR